VNATREQITELLTQGLSNTTIATQLRCDRHRVGDIRRSLDLPNVAAQPLTLEQKWETNARPVDGGHLEWTGCRQTPSGTPVLGYRGAAYTATRIAFRIKHGRDPQGYAYAECGFEHCIAPDHVDDEAGRARTREQLRYLTGGTERPQRCVHGHDQADHGRYGPNGVAYCEACKIERKRAERQQEVA
jgi:hypothetical protein